MNLRSLSDRVIQRVREVFFWLPTNEEEQHPEAGHDHALVIAVTGPERLPRLRQFRYALRVFSSAEVRIILAASLVAGAALIGAAFFFARSHIALVPVSGGTITEAVAGSPKSINPLDALTNDVDRDLVRLIYSGLFRFDGLTPVPDLADSYTWTDDGKTLAVKVRADARWQDGEPVTAEDVRFTFDSMQDPARKSPLFPTAHGFTVTADDALTATFHLDHSDSQFLQKLTVGILPAHLWQDIPPESARLSDLNLKPIGSGPFRVQSFMRDTAGNIHSFTLERFDRYYGVAPFLKSIVFQIFADRQQALDAYKAGQVDAYAFVSTEDALRLSSAQRKQDVKLELPEETVAFFNLKDKTLSQSTVRRALTLAINASEIVDALKGSASLVAGPYPSVEGTSTPPDLAQARDILDTAGWVEPSNGNVRIFAPKPAPAPQPATVRGKKPAVAPAPPTPSVPVATASSTELALTILTADDPDLLAVAETLKRQWSLLGVRVTIDPQPTEDLMRRATRERTAQVVLLNVFLGPEQDILPFWWSGQAVDRGLNISNLSNRAVDDALDRVRTSTSTQDLEAARSAVTDAIAAQYPGAFLIRPVRHYLVNDTFHGLTDRLILANPSERFQDIVHWYTKTGWRWK